MSKRRIRVPFFETGVKNYLFGDDVLDLAKAADAAAAENDVDVLFIAPYTEIRRVSEACPHIVVLAPYMDTLRPGRGLADVLPEALKAAGAQGVVINHCERPMTLSAIRKTIERADELDMLSFVCADTVAEARALAELHPDILNPEPSELIGSGVASDMGYILETLRAIKAIDPGIMVEQAAGITTARQVYDTIMAGSEAAGAASGIVNAADPRALLFEMVSQVRRAREDLIRQGRLAAAESARGGR